MVMDGLVLLPEWLRWVWVTVYAVIIIAHLRHALSEGVSVVCGMAVMS
jgi:hypothetical protein